MITEIAIISDRFMTAKTITEALDGVCGQSVKYNVMELPWPDEPMEHGYDNRGLEEIKEYMGTPDKVIDHVGSAPILITHLAPLTSKVFTSLPKLKFVAVTRGGPVNINITAARKHGVTVVNTPGRNASAVAEFTIGAIIAETRNISRGHDALRIGKYRGDLYRLDEVGNELSDMTIGVIGYGKVGTLVVSLLKGFGCRILVNDPYAQLNLADIEGGVKMTTLDQLLSVADVVTLHPRVTPETTGMIGQQELDKMKPTATIINTARGPLIDYDALYIALSNGNLRGAMLETFAIEPPPPDCPLLQLPNVTLTPHIAGASQKTVQIAARQVAKEVKCWLAGKPQIHPC